MLHGVSAARTLHFPMHWKLMSAALHTFLSARHPMPHPPGHMMVNKQPYDQYFKTLPRRNDVITPFAVTNTLGSFDVMVNVIGGGTTGQSQV